LNYFLILLILGVVQGITEFLPVSSSGHLVILEQVSFIKSGLEGFGHEINLFINVALHIATLVAVVIFLWKDIVRIIGGFFSGLFRRDFSGPEMKAALFIIAASVPAGLLGLAFHDFFETVFSSITSAFIMLIINGFVLIMTKKISPGSRKLEETGLIRSLIIGLFQAVAIMPGISRSGMTITGGMVSGLVPEESARFSFLIAIPVIAGAGLLEGLDALKGSFPHELALPLIASMAVTTAVAVISLKVLFYLVKKIRINIFGYYTIALGIAGLIIVKLI